MTLALYKKNQLLSSGNLAGTIYSKITISDDGCCVLRLFTNFTNFTQTASLVRKDILTTPFNDRINERIKLTTF